jgi:membrane protease YdiL (CAAX protease family)
MKQLRQKTRQNFQAAAAGCAGCAVAYLLLDTVFVRAAKAWLSAWLAGGGAGAPAASYEMRTWAASLFTGLLALALPAAFAIGAARMSAARLGLRRPRRGVLLPALCLYLGFSEAGNLIAAMVGEKTGSMQQLSLPRSPGALILAFLAICVVPAVCEEVLFRGSAQGFLRPYGPWLAIIGQAVLFALLHQKWSAVVFALPAGLYFGYLAENSGSLVPGIVLHFINNCAAFILLWLSNIGLGSAAQALHGAELIGFPLLAVGAAFWIIKSPHRPFRRLPRGASPAELLRCPPWLITVAGLALYCLANP